MKQFGKFKIKIENAVTGEVRELPEQNNLVLDKFFNLPEALGKWQFTYVVFGSGSTAPTRTDTTLENTLNSYIRSGSYADGKVASRRKEGNIITSQVEFTFKGGQGAVQGNVSELGLSFNYNDDKLFTRALIKDENGDPTTLTLTDKDILTVIYTFGWSIDLTSSLLSSQVININGVDTTCNFHAFGYDDPTATNYQGMWLLGDDLYYAHATCSKPISSIAEFFPFEGTITDFGNPLNNTYTNFYTQQYNSWSTGNGTANGTELYAKNTNTLSWGAGNSVGTWSGIIIKQTSNLPNVATNSNRESSFVILFDPPIVKGDTDVFQITENTFFAELSS